MRYLLGILLLASAAMAQDSLNVTRLGQLAYLNTHTIAVAEPYVYVTGSGNTWNDSVDRLHVFNVTNPTAPAQVGVVELTGRVWAIAVDGGYAYVATMSNVAGHVLNQIQVIAIQAPDAPHMLGAYPLPLGGTIYAIAAQGNYAYVACGGSGLRVIDVNEPAAPHETGTWSSPVVVTDVAIQGDTAYVTTTNGLYIIDVSNPSAPQEIWHLWGGSQDHLVMHGDYVYALRDEFILAIFRINLTIPVYVGLYGATFSVTDIVGNSRYVYAVCENWDSSFGGLQILDMTLPLNPAVVGSCSLPPLASPASPAVAVGNNYVYVADDAAGLCVIDVDTSSTAHRVGTWRTPSGGWHVAVHGGHAFVADDATGVVSLNVENPASIQPAGVGESFCGGQHSVESTGGIDDIAIRGNYAYVTNGLCYLQVFDIRNPTTLVNAGFVNSAAFSKELVTAGNHAYITDTQGLTVLNLSDSTQPTIMGHCNLTDATGSLAVNGSYAVVTTDDGSLCVVRITNPAAPVIVGHCPWIHAQDVVIRGAFAYTSGSTGIAIVDLNYPTAPVQIAHYDSLRSINDMAIAGDYLYVVDGESGLFIYDIRSPAQLLEVGHYRTASAVNQALAIDGNRVYVTCDNSLEVFDISAIVGAVGDPVIPQPTTFALGEAYPNPFNATTVIPFALPQTAHVSLKVYDVLGREAAVLVDGVREAGGQHVMWHAEGMASGVYFVRLEANGLSQTRKIMLMR